MRRARIKAVATLPPRRRPPENVKKMQDSVKEIIKSPGGLSVDKAKNLGTQSPTRNTLSPGNFLSNSRRTPESDLKISTQGKHCITPVSDNKSDVSRTSVFLSPQSRFNPRKRSSPAIQYPAISKSEIQGDENVDGKISRIENVELPNMPSEPPICEAEVMGVICDDSNENTQDTPGVMDGIIPLKPTINAPKPIELLKNEITSENAEVLFDPIVPLPSSKKVRPKLRPVPRLRPLRRSSIPGSASESEDENRRVLHGRASTPVRSRTRQDSHTSHNAVHSLHNRDIIRVRNNSVSSSISQTPHTPATIIGSPARGKNTAKNRRQVASRRMAAMRKKNQVAKREDLTMFDLIFYNPPSNPIIPDQDELKAKEANKQEEAQRLAEKKVDNPPEAESNAAVPQIKLGPNGEIVLDEESLVIKQWEQRPVTGGVVREGAWGGGRSGAYRRGRRSTAWTDAETVRFYRALATLGTDFTPMQELFPTRTRREIKLKFKKEERVNAALVDKALGAGAEWDPTGLLDLFTQERQLAEEEAKKEKEQLKKYKEADKERKKAHKELYTKISKSTVALESSVIPNKSVKCMGPSTGEEFIAMFTNEKKCQTKQTDSIFASALENKTTGPQNNTDPTLKSTNASLPKVEIPRVKPFHVTQNVNALKNTKPKPVQEPAPPRIEPSPNKAAVVFNALSDVPPNIQPGSLVVLTVIDPKDPNRKILHTYISKGEGQIAPVALPPQIVSHVVNHLNRDGPGSPLTSPGNSESKTSTPASVPSDRQRQNSYSLTDL